MFRLMIRFALCFMRRPHGLGIFPKCEAELDYCLLLDPLLWKCSHPNGLSSTHEAWVSSICQYTFFLCWNEAICNEVAVRISVWAQR